MQPIAFYVSPDGNDQWSGRSPKPIGPDGPFATIERARDSLREIRQEIGTAPITVWIRGGHYPLTTPIYFGAEDSGSITYAAYPGEAPIFDGGRRITNWQIERIGRFRRRAMWVADISALPMRNFRQLFANGQRRPRARLPKRGFYRVKDVPGAKLPLGLFDSTDTFRCRRGDIRNWRNLNDVEVVMLHFWLEERLPIASFDASTGIVRFARRTILAPTADFSARWARYYVENVFEGLTEPGEWYLDRAAQQLYYLPMPGESPETTEIVVPQIFQFLRLQGTEGLTFRGLKLAHNDWIQPIGYDVRFDPYRQPDEFLTHDLTAPTGIPPGEIEYAAAIQAAYNVPGAIYLEGASDCVIEDCQIEHIGGYGIELADGCLRNRIGGNIITDMGAGGIKLDGAGLNRPIELRTGDNSISDNHIHDGGHVFHSAAGILLQNTFGNRVAHNHVHDLYYTGISCGWMWHDGEQVSRDSLIDCNHIHHIGRGLLSDMGGVYILGLQPGTVIAGNLIHDIQAHGYGGWGIYLDQGSAEVLVEGNICYRASSHGLSQHAGRNNTIHNNIFAFNGSGQVIEHGLGPRPATEIAFTFERNLLISDGRPFFVGGPHGELHRRTFVSDFNVFWGVRRRRWHFIGVDAVGKRNLQHHTYDFGQWQALGQDRHSIIADPLFRDLRKNDFRIDPASPVLALGFRPIDLSDVGPRPMKGRNCQHS